VVDVTNPAAPAEIAQAFDMNYAYAVAVSGGMLILPRLAPDS